MPVCVLCVCTCMYLCVLPSVTEVDKILSEMYFPPHGWMGPHSLLYREETEAGIKCGVSSKTLPLATMQHSLATEGPANPYMLALS